MVPRSISVQATGRPERNFFLTLGLGSDQTEPLDLSVRKKDADNVDAPATATTLTKNDDDDVRTSA